MGKSNMLPAEVLRQWIYETDNGSLQILFQCKLNDSIKYFTTETGAYQQVPMRIRPISENEAISLMANL